MQKNTSVWDAFEIYGESVIKPIHNNPVLFDRWHCRLRDMETQILCDSDGDAIPDTNKFEKDGQTWGPIRWPYRAATEEALYSDPPMTFLLADHMVAIGSTGWDWKNKKSRWLGFDFDSIAGHADGVGVSDEMLAQIVERAPDWVEIVRSTRGNGRHLYILFDENDCPTTKTHTEHAALARAFLPLLSTAAGLDLDTSIDVCGQVLWFHHKKATPENGGYKLIRPSSKLLTTADVPLHWEDHIEVVGGERSKVRVRGYFDDNANVTDGDELDQMTQAYAPVRLDDTHHAILDALQGTGYTCLWVADHSLVQTHTLALKQVFDRQAGVGKPLVGLFETNSPGGDPGKPNCFMRPKENGAWDVYRFGQGTKEHPLWDRQGVWTHTTYNYRPSLAQIVAVAGGQEASDDKLGFQFDTLDAIQTALELLGSSLQIPTKAHVSRHFFLKFRKDGKLVVSITKERSDSLSEFYGWTKRPGGWEALVRESDALTDASQKKEEIWSTVDGKARMLKCVSFEDLGSMGGAFDGWVLKDASGKWIKQPRENIVAFLQSQLGLDFDPGIIGDAINKSWTVVNEPFKPEFPGGRIWNLGAPQYVYRPTDLNEGETPQHPHWDRVMNHCGCDLDPYIPHLDWCKEWGIKTGGDYMKAWIACMLRFPFLKLPYLFMYGPQNSGKSMFHEAISLLVTRGVVKADRALTSSSSFNGELLNAILGVIDEVDISKAGASVYNKLKEWTTGLTLSVHAKYKQVYETRSSLHFVQMSNSRSSCPVMGGDTRITAVYVPPLVEEIPKETLTDHLKVEGPDFMRTLMDWTIPEAMGRLRLPVIETRSKEDAMASNRSPLEAFIQDRCYPIDGAAVTLDDFILSFYETLDAVERTEWPRNQIRKELNERFPIGRMTGNRDYVGNLTMDKDAAPGAKLIFENCKLQREVL